MSSLKSEVDKLDIDKLAPVPVDLSKLSDVVRNDVVKKDVYDKLVTKVSNIDTSGFVLKTKYDTDKPQLENKIPDTSGLVKKTDYNTKITETEDKIPHISNLATKTALTTVENKIPDVNNLAAKTALTIVKNKIPHISNLATKTVLTTVEYLDIASYADDINKLEASSLPLFTWFNNDFMKGNSDKSHILLSCGEPSTALIDGSSTESNAK